MRLTLALMQSFALAVEVLGVLTGANIFLFVFEKTKGKRDVWDYLAMVSGLAFGSIMAIMAYETFRLVLSLV